MSGEGGAPDGAQGSESAPVAPELAVVVDSWLDLPAAVRAGIVAMVKAAQGGEDE